MLPRRVPPRRHGAPVRQIVSSGERTRARARCGSCGAESLRPYVQRTAAEESSRDCDLRIFRLRYITDYYSRRALVCACAHHRIGNNLAVSHLKQHQHTFLGQVSLSLFHPHDTSIPLDAISSDRSGRAPDAPPVARPCLQLAEPKRPRRDRGPLPLFSEFAAYRTAAQVAAHEGRLAAVRPFSQEKRCIAVVAAPLGCSEGSRWFFGVLEDSIRVATVVWE